MSASPDTSQWLPLWDAIEHSSENLLSNCNIYTGRLPGVNVDIFVKSMPAQQLSTECIFLNEALLCVSLAFGWFCPSLPSVSAEQKETCSESLVLKKKHAGIYLRFLLKIIFFSSSAMLLRWRQTLQPQLCVAHNSSGMSLCSVGHRSRCSQEVD